METQKYKNKTFKILINSISNNSARQLKQQVPDYSSLIILYDLLSFQANHLHAFNVSYSEISHVKHYSNHDYGDTFLYCL